MPNRTKRKESVQENFINLIQDFDQKKEKKNREKKTHQKGKGSIYLPSVVGLTRDPPILLSLSLSPIRLGSTKRKRQKEKKSTAAQIVAENPTKRTHIKKNHKSLRLGVYTSSGSTLRPTDRAAFPPSLSLLASPVTVMSLYIQLVGT